MTGSKDTAERLFDAYWVALALGRRDVEKPNWVDVPDGGQAWFAVANAVDRAAATPPAQEAFEYPLRGGILRKVVDDDAQTEVVEDLPTSLHVRPVVAADLCAGDQFVGVEESENAIYAHIHGVDVDLLEWRLDYADVQAARRLVQTATGREASMILRGAFRAAGGQLVDGDSIAWTHVAFEALRVSHDAYDLIRCRTGGVGEVKVGPVRAGHDRLYEDTAAQDGEWRGRFVALAKMTGLSVDTIEGMRTEDVARLWSSYLDRKKKSEVLAASRLAAAVSTRSTGGHEETSTS